MLAAMVGWSVHEAAGEGCGGRGVGFIFGDYLDEVDGLVVAVLEVELEDADVIVDVVAGEAVVDAGEVAALRCPDAFVDGFEVVAGEQGDGEAFGGLEGDGGWFVGVETENRGGKEAQRTGEGFHKGYFNR